MSPQAGADRRDLPFLDPRIAAVSVVLQLVLALFFGHLIDTRVNMAAGYLVATGQNPYVPQDLSTVFGSGLFRDFSTIGYPPPWPLALGLIYKSVYAVFPNLLAYNLAIKLPIVAANICLAYLVAFLLATRGASARAAKGAWLFMLLNPFVLYASAAWGQIDSIVALASLLSLTLLYKGRLVASASLLALGICLKPVALPLAIVAFVYVAGRGRRSFAQYTGVFAAGTVLLCVVPFAIFHWNPSIVLCNWNVHSTVGGCMSYMTFWELFTGSVALVGPWRLAGFAWVAALALFAVGLHRGIAGLPGLISSGAAAMLVFLLSRSWMSEPNFLVVLPFLVILAFTGAIGKRVLHAMWILAMVFSVFNASAVLLFFPSMPKVMDALLVTAAQYRAPLLIARSAVVVPWLVLGWRVVVICVTKKPATARAHGPVPEGMTPWT
jgi:hypothetical protein